MPKNYWQCDFCDYQDESESNVIKHETSCDHNPDNNILEESEDSTFILLATD